MHDEILELVRGRSSPGVIILDRNNRLIYANDEGLRLLNGSGEIPPEVQCLCQEVKKSAETGKSENGRCALLCREGESPCAVRAMLIGFQGEGSYTHIMVLLERVIEQHGVNLKKAKNQFGLSGREIEVVSLIARGLSNKAIALGLTLSEYTVKDHIKNIMRKMGASSRSEIIYILK